MFCGGHSYEIVTGPTQEPVSVDMCRRQARFDDTIEDSLFAEWIAEARQTLETLTSYVCMTQAIRLNLDYFPSWEIDIRRFPVVSITSVIYTDTAGSETTLSASSYRLDNTSFPPRLTPAYGLTWPTTREQTKAVKVLFVAGTSDVDNVDPIAKQAIRTRVAGWHANRMAMPEEYEKAFQDQITKLKKFSVV